MLGSQSGDLGSGAERTMSLVHDGKSGGALQ